MKQFTLSGILAFLSIAMFAQATFYTQNFSTAGLPSGWQNIDNSGGGKWTRKTSARGFASSTSSNGFYIFDSDAFGNDNKAENADLISSAINCSAVTKVALEFQQYFVQFANSEGTVSVSTDNATWQQVYAVSTNTDNPETVTIDISSIAAGQSTVYLKFNYQGDYDYFWAIDDIKLFVPNQYDVAVTDLTLAPYVGVGWQTIKGVIQNKGYEPITSLDIAYTVNGQNATGQSLTGINIAPFGKYNFSFSQKAPLPNPQKYQIYVEATAPNGQSDANASDNNSSKEISAISAIPEKNVLFEEFTTAQCGWCPDGHLVAKQLEEQYNYFIPVNIHAGFGTDAMTTSEASALATAFANGAPTANIDRVLYPREEEVAISRGLWEDKVVERSSFIVPVTISATSSYNTSTRELSVNATAKFYGIATGDFRINAYLVEDSVTGTGSGYNQNNYISGNPNFTNHPFYSLPDPIVGYVHRHVERKALGNTWGTQGVIPASTTDGGQYYTTFTYTIPAGFNTDRCHLIVFVNEYNSNAKSGKNEVLNAVELPLNGSVQQTASPPSTVGLADLNSPLNKVTVYPNPANEVVNLQLVTNREVSLSVAVSNMLGQTVYSIPATALNEGGFSARINTTSFVNGIYFISITEGEKVVSTQKFVVNR